MDKSMSSYVGFMVLNCLSGFVGGIGGVSLICFGYLADCLSPEHRAAIAGLVTAISCIGSAEAPDIYSRLWSEGDPPSRCLFTIMVVYIASVLFCASMPESGEKRSTSRSEGAMSLNPLQNFRLLTQPEKTDSRSCLRKLFIALFLLYTSKFAVKSNIDVYAKNTYDFTTTQRGRLQQMFGFVEIIGYLTFALGARFGTPHRVLICAGALLAFLSPLLLALPDMKIWSLYVADALLALAPGVMSVSLAMATEVVRPSESAEAAAVVKAALSLANATGRGLYSCLSALFLTSDYPGAIFLVLSLVAFVDVGFCFVLPSKRQLQQIRDRVQPACDACSEC
jgi:predicted MFS family arabinose efflux permease